MKTNAFIVALLLAVCAFAADKTLVTVKNTSVSNGVVIVTISEQGKTFELQCNQSAPNCTALKAGSYLMERLPKNRGLYDCDNVDVYPQSEDQEIASKLAGEYCLNNK